MSEIAPFFCERRCLLFADTLGRTFTSEWGIKLPGLVRIPFINKAGEWDNHSVKDMRVYIFVPNFSWGEKKI